MESANPFTDASAPKLAQATICDLSLRSVRVLRRRENGFVEFEFSVGWPELMVELIMLEEDFQAFCKTQQVRVL